MPTLDRPSRALLTNTLAAALLAGASLTLAPGCASDRAADASATPGEERAGASSGSSSPHRRRVRLYSRRDEFDTPLPQSTALVVRASGPVSIIEGDLETMLVRSQVAALTPERLEATRHSFSTDQQGRTVLDIAWPAGRREHETASFEIRLPRGARALEVEAGGVVTLTGVRCDTTVRTANGAVTVVDHTGAIDATTTNAQVSFERVSGSLRAETSNGIVLVREARGPVDVRTSRAAIDVRLASDAPGPVRAETEMGAIALRVGPGFRGELTMRTADAPIVVDMKPGAARIVSRRIDETIMQFADSPTRSLLSTSGGTIELRVMER